MHPTGFEPVLFIRKRIMSPLPSTTRPRMQNKNTKTFISKKIWNWWESNPRPFYNFKYIFTSLA